MKWQGRRQSRNVEDRRGTGGRRGGKVAAGGGVIGIIAVLLMVFGGETGQQIGGVLQQVNQQQSTSTSYQQSNETQVLTPQQKQMGEFVATVFADTEDIWGKIFAQSGNQYPQPKMVLFSDQVNTACGAASASTGPFYCPGDQKVYMDLVFFDELRTRFGAKGGDFAVAYVVAHEVGHHIQTVLGTSNKMRQMQRSMSKAQANQLSVCLELQADFFAGIWAHYNKKYIEAGDIDEALSAAHAVGDDAIQKRMQGHVIPDSFTHGTSAQRKEWFTLGYTTGDLSKRNTFAHYGFNGFE